MHDGPLWLGGMADGEGGVGQRLTRGGCGRHRGGGDAAHRRRGGGVRLGGFGEFRGVSRFGGPEVLEVREVPPCGNP